MSVRTAFVAQPFPDALSGDGHANFWPLFPESLQHHNLCSLVSMPADRKHGKS